MSREEDHASRRRPTRRTARSGSAPIPLRVLFVENNDHAWIPGEMLQTAIVTTTMFMRQSVLRTRSWERGGELPIELTAKFKPVKNTAIMTPKVSTEMCGVCGGPKKVVVASTFTRLYDEAP